MPTMQPGYAYIYTGEHWRQSMAVHWDTTIPTSTELAGCEHVGQKFIDGSRCNVFKAASGVFFAQVALG